MTDDTQIILGETQTELDTRTVLTDGVRAALDVCWQLAESLPEDQRAQVSDILITGYNNMIQLQEIVSRANEQLARAGAFVDAAAASNKLLVEQRDHIADELAKLANAIERRDINHPIIRAFYSDMYENVMEQHNANFWESLPYDMAAMLGKGWEFYDADTLYTLLTADFDNEGDPEDFGWTMEQVNKFRAKLLKLVKGMDNGDE